MNDGGEKRHRRSRSETGSQERAHAEGENGDYKGDGFENKRDDFPCDNRSADAGIAKKSATANAHADTAQVAPHLPHAEVKSAEWQKSAPLAKLSEYLVHGKTKENTAAKSESKERVEIRHDGHRSRLRASAARDSTLEAFSDAQLLEMLLAFFVPRKDMADSAHEALAHAELCEILNDAERLLAPVKNVTELAVKTVAAMADTRVWRGACEISLETRLAAVDYFGSLLMGTSYGVTHAAYLDARYRMIAHEEYGAEFIAPRKILSAVYRYGARYVVVARREHGLFYCGFDDAARVDALSELLEAMGARLLDFLLFTEFGYYATHSADGDTVFVFTPIAAAMSSPDAGEIFVRTVLTEKRNEE